MITMEHVCKSYKIAKRNAGFKEACKALFRRETEEIRALSDVSFQIGDGEMVGYIGPNGAGKSTLMNMIAGFLVPSEGKIKVLGKDNNVDVLEAKRNIADRLGKPVCVRIGLSGFFIRRMKMKKIFQFLKN